MSIFELARFSIPLLLGIYFGKVGYQHFAWPGLLVGFIAGCAALPLLVRLIFALNKRK
jgi:hypothetical protein